jgi:hypothetical protein
MAITNFPDIFDSKMREDDERTHFDIYCLGGLQFQTQNWKMNEDFKGIENILPHSDEID